MQKGSIFEGNFAMNKFEGEGTMESEGGERYVGGWKANLKHGDGEYYWPDGSVYRGEYRNGEREGLGLMTYANRESYEGEWQGGLKHGRGTYRTLKKTLCGVWQNGDLLS